MTGSINGTRYLNLLTAGGITGAELDTEWADAGRLGAFLYLWNRSVYRNLLTRDYTPYNILKASDYFQDNVNRSRGYVLGATALNGFRFSDETYMNLGSGYTGLANSNGGTTGFRQSALYCRSLTKMYKYNYITQSYYEETNATFGASENLSFTAQTDDEGFYLGSNSNSRDLRAWNFQNNTDQDTSNVLAVGGYNGGSAENDTHAYFFGGQLSSGNYSTEIQGLVKATKTSNNPAAVLATGANYSTCSETATDMYIFGGSTGSDTNRIEKFNISGESISAVSDTLTNAKYNCAAFRNNDYDIYIMGSNTSSETEIEKFNGSTDAISTLSASITSSVVAFNQCGLVGGGFA